MRKGVNRYREMSGISINRCFPNLNTCVHYMYNLSSFHFFEGLSSRDNPSAPIASADAKRRTACLCFANPMDPNWGGAEYTQYLIDANYYKDNEVMIKVP